MTLHPPKPAAKKKPQRRPAPAMTIGAVLGDKIRAVQAERVRRAQLDDMGFREVKGAP